LLEQGQEPLKHKVTPITDTPSGIRRATIRAFIRERARVVVFSRCVRVNSVAPRLTDTRMLDRFSGTPEDKAAPTSVVPRDCVGKSDDIARTILFLASGAASSFVTNRADARSTAAGRSLIRKNILSEPTNSKQSKNT
jgi:NAD(P)-dependent dehydrogenase (short-subunit alcohol dehydrogenase family)